MSSALQADSSDGELPPVTPVTPLSRPSLLPRPRLVVGLVLATVGCGTAVLALSHRLSAKAPSPEAPPVQAQTHAEAEAELSHDDLARIFMDSYRDPEETYDGVESRWEDSTPAGDEYLDDLFDEEQDGSKRDHQVLIRGLQEKWTVVTQARAPVRLPAESELPEPKAAAWKLVAAFKKADSDGDGLLRGHEMGPILDALQKALDLSSARLDELYDHVGHTAKTWDLPDVRRLAALLFLFKEADRNKDDLLSHEELKYKGLQWAEKLANAPMAPSTVPHRVKMADGDSDGELNATELSHMLAVAWGSALGPVMVQIFTQTDADRNGVLQGLELRALAVELRSRFMLPAEEYEKLATADRLNRAAFKRLFVEARSCSPMARLPKPLAVFFAAVDKDRSGSVAGAELDLFKNMLQWKFWVPNPALQVLITAADANADDQLSAEEFKDCIVAAKARSPFALMGPREVGLFRKADQDHDLLLEGSELVYLVQMLQAMLHQPKEQIEKKMQAADADEDGKLRPQELKRLFVTLWPAAPSTAVSAKRSSSHFLHY